MYRFAFLSLEMSGVTDGDSKRQGIGIVHVQCIMICTQKCHNADEGIVAGDSKMVADDSWQSLGGRNPGNPDFCSFDFSGPVHSYLGLVHICQAMAQTFCTFLPHKISFPETQAARRTPPTVADISPRIVTAVSPIGCTKSDKESQFLSSTDATSTF